MGRTATVIAVSYTIVSVLAIGFVVFIALSTRSRRKLEDERTLYTLGERERTWFVVVIALLVALLFATIFFTPYGKSAGPDAQVEHVSALQFAWIMKGKPIRAGTPVEFVVTSRDVNHNFAVYTAGGRFLFQLQVVPGKTQRYVYTFGKPGTYQVLCLEYCGLGHDAMQTSFTVR